MRKSHGQTGQEGAVKGYENQGRQTTRVTEDQKDACREYEEKKVQKPRKRQKIIKATPFLWKSNM